MSRTRSFDEDAVLEAAKEQFWTTGYAGARVDDIAAATGLGKGSLYGAFGDKHALFLTVFEAHCDGLVAGVRTALDGPDEGAYARLSRHLERVARATASDTARRGCLLARGTAELSGQDPEVAAVARRTFRAIEDSLTACIAAAQRAGDLAAEPPARDLALLVLAVLRGIEALGKGGASRAALRTVARTALALLPRAAA